jgi:uncharacterized protein (UPF0261 family)/ABC-type branched-subunit amino acid transport system ATPase component
MSERERARAAVTGLQIKGLNVYYGASHALQGVDLELASGVLSVVGRNGMGKTTLCKAIMGLVPIASGSIRFAGEELVGKDPATIARIGVGYVPQGRRLWRSLTVDEHLQMVAKGKGSWSIERIYQTFPRLAERRGNGGGQLSGGEQQMLAIARALLLNPRLLVMDEPTEGLAPLIVAQVEDMLVKLGEEGGIDVLVIEQNIGVATAISAETAIMVNGRINRIIGSGTLAADRDLQQRLLGVGRHGEETAEAAATARAASREAEDRPRPAGPTKIYISNPRTPTRWSSPLPVAVIEQSARTVTLPRPSSEAGAQAELRPLAGPGESIVLVAGTLDTKGAELRFIRDIIRAAGLPVRIVDVSTSGKHSGAEIPAHLVAAFHPRGASGVFTSDRGQSVGGMTIAFERWIRRQTGIAGIIAAGGSGGTAIVAPAMRVLAAGVPKLIVSTVASGDVSAYVGPTDITMMHSIADVEGLNVISRAVLANAAHAMIGMVQGRRKAEQPAKAAQPSRLTAGLTMFGVTTPAVKQVVAGLGDEAECIVFHATGIGGRSMEKLVDSGMLMAAVDITTTEVADMLVGGIFPATEDRFGAIIRTRIPYIGSCGALDMVNFGAPETVPERFRARTLYQHNPQVTLMRTTPDECAAIGRWIGEKLNQMDGPVRFYLPEGGVSALDAPGKLFHNPAADAALFRALEQTVRQTATRLVVRLPHNINDPAFAAELVRAFHQLHGGSRPSRKRMGR